MGDVASLLLVQPARPEILRPEIWRGVEGMVAAGGAPELLAADDRDAVPAQQTGNAKAKLSAHPSCVT